MTFYLRSHSPITPISLTHASKQGRRQKVYGIVQQGPDFTETISDPSEIQKNAFDLIKYAKEEITILFSTANGYKRQERAGLMQLLQETDPAVKSYWMNSPTYLVQTIIKYSK